MVALLHDHQFPFVLAQKTLDELIEVDAMAALANRVVNFNQTVSVERCIIDLLLAQWTILPVRELIGFVERLPQTQLDQIR